MAAGRKAPFRFIKQLDDGFVAEFGDVHSVAKSRSRIQTFSYAISGDVSRLMSSCNRSPTGCSILARKTAWMERLARWAHPGTGVWAWWASQRVIAPTPSCSSCHGPWAPWP